MEAGSLNLIPTSQQMSMRSTSKTSFHCALFFLRKPPFLRSASHGLSTQELTGEVQDLGSSTISYTFGNMDATVAAEISSIIVAEINQMISDQIGPIAKLDKIQFVEGLPKTRSGKIMRRILRKIACNETDQLGDTSTLLNEEVVKEIIDNSLIK